MNLELTKDQVQVLRSAVTSTAKSIKGTLVRHRRLGMTESAFYEIVLGQYNVLVDLESVLFEELSNLELTSDQVQVLWVAVTGFAKDYKSMLTEEQYNFLAGLALCLCEELDK